MALFRKQSFDLNMTNIEQFSTSVTTRILKQSKMAATSKKSNSVSFNSIHQILFQSLLLCTKK